ncbi:MAG: hypothetical protein ACAF41_01795 [Leptolyngbya sp. BL-A-14]
MQQPDRLPSLWSAALTPSHSSQQASYSHSGTQTVTPSSQQQAEPIPVAAKQPRRRGLVLTEQGWQKLLQAEVAYNQYGERCTFEALSEKTLLDPRTICRIIEREIGVDKRSLIIFFHAFNLPLENGDYTSPARITTSSQQAEDAMLSSVSPSLPFFESYTAPEELRHIRARIIEDCCRLVQLLGLDHADQTTLSIKMAPQAAPQLELNVWRSC